MEARHRGRNGSAVGSKCALNAYHAPALPAIVVYDVAGTKCGVVKCGSNKYDAIGICLGAASVT